MRKKIWYGVFSILLIFALSRLNLRETLSSILQIPLWTAALLLMLQIISQLLVNLQWYRVANFSSVQISFRDMFLVNCQGAMIDSITPGVKVGGEVTRAVQISRMADCSGEKAAAVIAVQKLFSLGAFFFINLFAIGFVISGSSMLHSRGLQFTVYGILVFFLLIFVFVFLMPHKIKAFLLRRENRSSSESKIGRAVHKVRAFALNSLSGLISIRSNSGAFIRLLALSFFIWLLYPAKFYLLTMHFYPEAGLIFLGAVTFAAYMVAMIPIFPGGLGGFEATMTGLLPAVGFAQSEALAVAVIFRFFTFWFVMLFSIGYVGLNKIKIPFTMVQKTGGFRRA